MRERTGKTIKTATEGVTLHPLTDGETFEVERDGVVLGTVGRYLSRTEVKPGKVRASERRKPVQRWNAHVKGGRGSYNLRSRTDAVSVLLDDVAGMENR